MEKEILEKIYLLRKVKPESSFVEETKQSILQGGAFFRDAKKESVISEEKQHSFFDALVNPVFQSRLAVVGAFAFLLVFGALSSNHFPFEYDYGYVYNPVIREDLRMVAQDDEDAVEVATTNQSLQNEFNKLKNAYELIQRQVLGTMIEEEKGVDSSSLTDKEIVEYFIAKFEEEDTEDTVQIMGMLSVEEEKDEEESVLESLLEDLKEAYEEEDYIKGFDIIVERESIK